jgi:hypothetical protein
MSTATPTQPAVTLPFGKHAGQPLPDVPSSYLDWMLRSCKLSSGLRATIAGELSRRGIEAPAPPPPPPIPKCHRCGAAGYLCNWQEDSLGRKRIRASCRQCGLFLTFPPSIPPFTAQADEAASPAPILDALTKLEAIGVELQSDGKRVFYRPGDWRRVPPDLRAVVRQCGHQMAQMIGNTTGRRD